MPLAKNEYVSDIWKDGIFDLKVVFCTGGAGTICSAQVRALVHLGANACIIGRNVEKTEKMAEDIATARKGSKVLGIGAVDVRNVGSLQNAVGRCVDEIGAIDYVMEVIHQYCPRKVLLIVYSAGAAGNFLAPISQLSSNAFKSVIDIDVLGSYNTLKATLPSLLQSAAKNKCDGRIASPSGTGGRIIFISATIHYTGVPLQAHVGVAKAGVDVLSHTTAIEFGPRHVTSNVIAPGPIGGTEGMDRLAKAESHEGTKRGIPLGRPGTVKDIADATVYLFSDAGNFVSGQTLVVDGAAWRTMLSNSGAGFKYPDFLLSDETISGVKGAKKTKL